LLATGTFTAGTASGWQQLNFSTPITISANTTYVASAHSGGPYYASQNYFQNVGVDNPPLHAVKDGVEGANGVYVYGPGGLFPNQGYLASNYWVDVIFVPSGSGAAQSVAAYSGTPQSTTIGTSFVALQAKVIDASSSPVSGVTVTFVAPTAGASATFGGSGSVAVTTNSAGIATSPIPTANNIAGTYSLMASVAGLQPATFSLTNTMASSGYQHSRPITIRSGQVPSTQTNFPVLVAGTYPYLAQASLNSQGMVQTSTGVDINFTSDAAGNNLLPFEQEKYVAGTGEIAYWVKLPSVLDGTTFYMSYGNSSATDQSNRAGVWDTNFKGVWHMHNSGSPMTDSTANGINAAASAVTFGANGKVDGAINLSGTTSYISTANTPFNYERTDSFGASTWVKLPPASAEQVIISKENTMSPYRGWGVYAVSNGAVRVFLTNTWPGNNIAKNSAAAVDDNNWHHVAFTYNGSSQASGVNIYVDGVLSNGTVTHDSLSSTITTTTPLFVGAWANPAAAYTGTIDELRIFTISPVGSASWIRTEYNNQSAPQNFYSIGPEQ
jgi:hypothetical protein